MPIEDFLKATGGDVKPRILEGVPSRTYIACPFGKIVWQRNSGEGPGGNVYDDEEMDIITDAVEGLSDDARRRLQEWIYKVKVAFQGRVV